MGDRILPSSVDVGVGEYTLWGVGCNRILRGGGDGRLVRLRSVGGFVG